MGDGIYLEFLLVFVLLGCNGSEPIPGSPNGGANSPGDSSTPDSPSALDAANDVSGRQDAGGVDARPLDVDAPDVPALPDGGALAPVFVALSDGGWTATSCDRGETWHAREYSSERDDHSEWSAFGGLAFGNGVFAGGLGWGAPGHVITSRDGFVWSDLPFDAFYDGEVAVGLESSVGGLVFDGEEFLLFGRYVWSSSDGYRWTRTARTLPPGAHQLRQLRAFPERNLVVASIETQRASERPVGHSIITSRDGGESWLESSNYDGECSALLQLTGDIALLGDTLIAGSRRLCRSTDLGRSWTSHDSPFGGRIGTVFTDSAAFYMLADRWANTGGVWRSTDGLNWSMIADVGAGVARGAHKDGTYIVSSAGNEGGRFFRSEDGESWSEGVLLDDLGVVQIREIGVGWGRCNE